MPHLQTFSHMQVQFKDSWGRNQDPRTPGSWLSGVVRYCFMEHRGQAQVYSLLPAFIKQGVMQRGWIRMYWQKVTPFKKEKKCGLQGRHYWVIFVQVGKIKAAHSLSRRQQGLIALAGHVWHLCGALGVFGQPLPGRMVYDGASLPAGL